MTLVLIFLILYKIANVSVEGNSLGKSKRTFNCEKKIYGLLLDFQSMKIIKSPTFMKLAENPAF